MPQLDDQDPTNYHGPAPVPSPSVAPPKHVYNGTKYEDRHAAETAREKDRAAGTLPHDASISVDMGTAEDTHLTSAYKEEKAKELYGAGDKQVISSGDVGSRISNPVATPSPAPKKSLAEIAAETKAKREALKAQVAK
jgi:hypothetical protein